MTSIGSVPEFPLVIDGKDWIGQVATCERFSLMTEDHGLFTAFVDFTGADWGQGLPVRGLDEFDKASRHRYGTAFGCDFIMQCVRVLGSPEHAAGTQVVVFRQKNYGEIEGFARLNADGSIGEPFFPAELAAKHYPTAVPA